MKISAIIMLVAIISLMPLAAAAPLSPQAQQANPTLQQNPSSPYGYANQVTVQGIPQFTSGNIAYTILGIFIGLFIIFFSLIILVRYHQMQTAHVGDGRRIDGRYRCFIWGKGWFDFRATEVAPDEIAETLEIVKNVDEIKEKKNLSAVLDKLVNYVKNGNLHLYEIKVISRRNMRIRGNLGYSLLLSSEPIDDRRFFYQSRNAVLAPFSGNWKEHPKIIDCIAQSKIYTDIEMADREQTTTVYVIGPVSGDFVKDKQQVFGENLEEFKINPVSINVNLMQMNHEITEVLTIMRTVADTYETGAAKKRENKILMEINEKLVDTIVDKNAENTLAKSKIGERALVVLGEKIIQDMYKETWTWIMAAIIMGFIGLELPKWIPQLATTDQAVTFFICEGFVLLLKVLSDKQKEDPYKKYKSKEQQIQMGSGQMEQMR